MAQLAPLKVRVGTTVEEAPSHDGSPTCAAYENRPKGWNRPLFALRVYDTTAHTTSADHVCHAAQVVHEYTMSYHYGIGRSEADRIEVVDLPMAAAATDDERAQKCKEHNLAEIAARSGAGLKDWFLHGTFKTDSHLYLIAVITRSNEGWEQAIKSTNEVNLGPLGDPLEAQMDSFGTFLNVWWGVGEDVIVDEEEGETLYPEMVVVPAKIASLSRCLYWMRPEIEWFYIHYAREQGLIGSSD